MARRTRVLLMSVAIVIAGALLVQGGASVRLLTLVVVGVLAVVGLAALERTRQDLELRNTELEQANTELEQTNARLDAASRERQRFLSAVSHDLRNPLTSVGGFATLLRSRWDDLSAEQRREFLARIEASTATMDAMLGDLLTLSRLEEGVVVPSPRALDLPDFLPAMAAQLGGTTVEVTVATGTVHADPEHLRRILGNLVDNARKYGAPPIQLSSQVVDDVVEVRVRDHGAGVDADFAEVLFEAFSQARPGQGIDAGVGLGLSIVQHLATQNGGTVAHVPDVEPGACFVVRLPRVTEQARPASAVV